MRSATWLALLTGCGAPISNAAFYEDELFLSGFPSFGSLASPVQLREAPVGDSVALSLAVSAAADLDGVTAPLAASGEILRQVDPTEREALLRVWDPVVTGLEVDGTPVEWAVRAEATRPMGGTTIEWTLEGSSAGSAWTLLGSGTWDGVSARYTWELGEHGALLQLADPLPVQISIETGPTEEGERMVLVEEVDPVGLGVAWHGLGEQSLSFGGSFALTEDTQTWPGALQAVHQPDLGGWAVGTLFTAEGELPVRICWNADGNDVFRSEGLSPIGAESDCPSEPTL